MPTNKSFSLTCTLRQCTCGCASCLLLQAGDDEDDDGDTVDAGEDDDDGVASKPESQLDVRLQVRTLITIIIMLCMDTVYVCAISATYICTKVTVPTKIDHLRAK